MKFAKRFWLLLILSSWVLLYIPYFVSYWYIAVMALLTTLTIFITYPELCVMMHKKPIYFEDLRHDIAEPGLQSKFQRYFIIVIAITLSCIISLLLDYIVYHFQNTTLSRLEQAGFLGGVLSLFNKCQTYIGRGLLKVLIWRKRAETPTRANNIRSNVRCTGHCHTALCISPESSPNNLDEQDVVLVDLQKDPPV